MAGHKFRDEKRRHAGTDNEDTAGDLIDDILYIVEKLDARCKEGV
jgi:energy-converting hydrogenase Eha subunit F